MHVESAEKSHSCSSVDAERKLTSRKECEMRESDASLIMKMICNSRRSAQVKLSIPGIIYFLLSLSFKGSLKVSILPESLLRGSILISGTFRLSFGHSADLICIMYKIQARTSVQTRSEKNIKNASCRNYRCDP